MMRQDLAGLTVPGPTDTPLSRPFWETAAAGRLLVQRCGGCGAAILYPRALCPRCWSDDLAWEEASGRGTLLSFAVVHRPGHPGWQPAAPYAVALVRLAEGPAILTLIPGTTGEDIEIGAAVRFAPTEIGDRVLPAFLTDARGDQR